MGRAQDKEAILGAALAGSGARGDEDAWSDIDLVLQLSERRPTNPRWWPDGRSGSTREFGIADTVDVIASGVRYRVFLLPSSLQIDVSFWPGGSVQGDSEPGFGSTLRDRERADGRCRHPTSTPRSAWAGCTPCTPAPLSPAAGPGKPS